MTKQELGFGLAAALLAAFDLGMVLWFFLTVAADVARAALR